MRRPRVAFVSFAFGEYSIRLASALAKHAEVGLWLTEWQAAPHARLLPPEVEFRPFPKPRMRQPLLQLRVMWRLYRQIRAFRPDIVHLQQGYLWFNPGLWMLRGIPLLVTVHDPTPHLGDRLGNKTPQAVADLAYRAADALIVHNDEMRQVVADRGIAGTRPIHVVPHVSLGELTESLGEANEPSGPANGPPSVLFFGRIWPYKGLEYLIRAEPLITAIIPDARIVIAGQGEDFQRYEGMMVNPDRFEVHNRFIPADEVARLFRDATVVVLPYVEATQSGVIPLAYSFGRPVVATTVGGLPSMVEDGVTGYLVAPGDAGGLAEAVIRLLKDPELRATLGRQARHRAATEFSPATVAVQTLDVYRTLLEGAQAKKR